MRDSRREPGRGRKPVYDPWKPDNLEQQKNRQLMKAIFIGLAVFLVFTLIIAYKLMKSKEEDVADILKGKTDARLTFVKGEVQILRKSTGQWEKGETNTIINEGDTLDTGPSYKSVLAISDIGDSVRLERRSALEIGKLYKDKTTGKVGGNLSFENGRIWVKIKNAEKFELKTPWGKITTSGSSFEIKNNENEKKGEIIVWGGKIEVVKGGDKLPMTSGQMLRIEGGALSSPENAGMIAKDDWEKWNDKLTAQENAPLPPDPGLREDGKNIFELPGYPAKKKARSYKTFSAPGGKKARVYKNHSIRPGKAAQAKARPRPQSKPQSQFQVQSQQFQDLNQKGQDIWQIHPSSGQQVPQPARQNAPQSRPAYTPPPYQAPPPPAYRPPPPPTPQPTPQPTAPPAPPRVPGFDLGAPPVGPSEH